MGAMGAHFAHRLDIKNGYFISILEKDKASIFRRAFDVASKAFFHSGNEQNSYFSQIIWIICKQIDAFDKLTLESKFQKL